MFTCQKTESLVWLPHCSACCLARMRISLVKVEKKRKNRSMKRIRVNKGFVGLVFKNDDYQRIVTAGKHWLNFGEEVRYCNKAKLLGAKWP